MNALPPLLEQCMRGWMPPADTDSDGDRIASLTAEVIRLKERIGELTTRYETLLRLPFEYEVMVEPAHVSGPSENCSEAEYMMRTADDGVVRAAVDWLIDKHFDELEDDIAKRQEAADRKALP